MSRSSPLRKRLTTEQLCDIWEKIRSDPDARKALERLDKAGFRISHLKPSDATFKHPSWADYIAALPLLPNKPSTRRIHLKTSVRKYLPLVRELREFATTLGSPFVNLEIFGSRDYPQFNPRTVREEVLKTASTLEYFLSLDYCVRYLNSRNAVIAELRWTIRFRIGKPHDRDLNILIDAAFRAAGFKDGCCIDATTLDRIEKRDKESRVKANRRIRYLIGASASSRR
jgi:hypothetical protein